MNQEIALKIVNDWNNQLEDPFDKIVYCGIEDECHFVHLDLKNKPKYAGFGVGLRIYPDGKIKEINDFLSCNNMLANARCLTNNEKSPE